MSSDPPVNGIRPYEPTVRHIPVEFSPSTRRHDPRSPPQQQQQQQQHQYANHDPSMNSRTFPLAHHNITITKFPTAGCQQDCEQFEDNQNYGWRGSATNHSATLPTHRDPVTFHRDPVTFHRRSLVETTSPLSPGGSFRSEVPTFQVGASRSELDVGGNRQRDDGLFGFDTGRTGNGGYPGIAISGGAGVVRVNSPLSELEGSLSGRSRGDGYGLGSPKDSGYGGRNVGYASGNPGYSSGKSGYGTSSPIVVQHISSAPSFNGVGEIQHQQRILQLPGNAQRGGNSQSMENFPLKGVTRLQGNQQFEAGFRSDDQFRDADQPRGILQWPGNSQWHGTVQFQGNTQARQGTAGQFQGKPLLQEGIQFHGNPQRQGMIILQENSPLQKPSQFPENPQQQGNFLVQGNLLSQRTAQLQGSPQQQGSYQFQGKPQLREIGQYQGNPNQGNSQQGNPQHGNPQQGNPLRGNPLQINSQQRNSEQGTIELPWNDSAQQLPASVPSRLVYAKQPVEPNIAVTSRPVIQRTLPMTSSLANRVAAAAPPRAPIRYRPLASIVDSPGAQAGMRMPQGAKFGGVGGLGGVGGANEKEAEIDALTDLLVQNMSVAGKADFFGMCAKCGEPIMGEVNGWTALDQLFHVDCFHCCGCEASLISAAYYALEGKPYCENCFEATLQKCSVCSELIRDRVLRVAGKPLHPVCFTCVICEKSLDGVMFTIDSTGQNLCIDDYHRKYAPRCCVCALPIMPSAGHEEAIRIVALDRSFHIDCYRCEDCALLLSSEADGRGCYPLDGHVLCRACNARRIQALTSKRTTDL